MDALPVLADQAPTLTNNINSDVKRTLSGLVLPPSVTADIDTLANRVRPWMVMQDGTEYPLGVFVFADASRARTTAYDATTGVPATVAPDGLFTTGTLADLLATLNQGSRGINFYGPGTLVTDALEQQLLAGNITDYVIEPSDAQIAQWTVWAPNTKRSTVINDLCKLGGYYSLYFDNMGTAQAKQVPALEGAEAQFVWEPGANVLADSIVESDDLLKAPNTYVVVNTAHTESPIWGQWLVPASAPHSYANRGFWVVAEYDIQGVNSNGRAKVAAKAIGQADFASYRWVNLETAIDPTYDTFNIVEYRGDKYRTQSWEFQLSATATMKHEARRIWAEDLADIVPEDE